MTSAASRQPPSSGSSLLWGAATLLAALVGAPIHWRAGALAALAGVGALVLRRYPVACSAVLTLGGAPLWLAAASDGLGRLLIIPALVLLLLHRAGLPRAVPWLVLALASVQALRLMLLEAVVPDAVALSVPILIAGLAVAAAATATPTRTPALSLVLSGAILLALSGRALRTPSTTADALKNADAWGVLFHQALPDAALAEQALALHPQWHEVASMLPTAQALAAGWRPEGASLPPLERVAVARWLERDGRGGEGTRLLKRGTDPTLGWWRVLFDRIQGRARPWTGGEGPAQPHHSLPAEHPIELRLVQSGTTELLLHAEDDLTDLSILLSGEWFEGPPELEIVMDATPRLVQVSREPRAISLGPVSAGPHRILLRFLNDLQGARGDRNITVHALMGQ